MPRSPEGIARRLEYGRQWRLAHPTYSRDRHRQNTAKECVQRIQWKKANPEKVAQQQARYRQAHRPVDKIVESSHPIIEEAKSLLVIRPDDRTEYNDCLYEDALSVAILSLVENSRKPKKVRHQIVADSIKAFLGREKFRQSMEMEFASWT